MGHNRLLYTVCANQSGVRWVAKKEKSGYTGIQDYVLCDFGNRALKQGAEADVAWHLYDTDTRHTYMIAGLLESLQPQQSS